MEVLTAGKSEAEAHLGYFRFGDLPERQDRAVLELETRLGLFSSAEGQAEADRRTLADFGMLILYGRVLRNLFISSITCASFER